jgi:hypothetical protein
MKTAVFIPDEKDSVANVSQVIAFDKTLLTMCACNPPVAEM